MVCDLALKHEVELMSGISILQKIRSEYRPKLPAVFAQNGPAVAARSGEPTESVGHREQIRARFPNTYGLPIVTFEPGDRSDVPALNVGVVLSGGQAPGGHNVIAGIFDALKAMNEDSRLFGFLGGPSGMTDNACEELTGEVIDAYRNTGGFDMIGSGRTKLESDIQYRQVAETCEALGINAVVVIGGDDSNTNACMLAEYFCQHDAGIQVIGCPKTIDGDLKNDRIEASFGFDTATKVYSELIGNIQRDALSAKKYWHFIKLMGRSASHIALECALKTHPNVTIISEEVADRKQTLKEITQYIAGVVMERAEKGMNFGVVLVPEGLIEFVPEMKGLISELNDLLAENDDYFNSLPSTDDKLQFVNSRLGPGASQTFSSLPGDIQMQLLMDRDPHGNVQVSRIETEKLLVDMVGDLLREWKAKDRYHGKFSHQTHFLGYEGRCAAPSNFDADYCYGLGYTAACLIAAGKTGYMATVQGLAGAADTHVPAGIPMTMMMNVERRKGADHPVIRKALVALNGAPFKAFAASRADWERGNRYTYPGPIQYFGPSEVADQPPETLLLEHQ